MEGCCSTGQSPQRAVVPMEEEEVSNIALGPTQPPIEWVPVLSWGKAAGAWR
jgi:hypothetical protein